MLKWTKVWRKTGPEGTTNKYEAEDAKYPIAIESRKRHIPHANGRSGTWDHTTYFVLKDGKELIEKYSLADAKEYAEALIDRLKQEGK